MAPRLEGNRAQMQDLKPFDLRERKLTRALDSIMMADIQRGEGNLAEAVDYLTRAVECLLAVVKENA